MQLLLGGSLYLLFFSLYEEIDAFCGTQKNHQKEKKVSWEIWKKAFTCKEAEYRW